MPKKSIYIFLIVIASILLCYSTFHIITWFKENKETAKVIKSLNHTPKREINDNNYPTNFYNPPENKEDSYWQYVTTPFLEVDFTDLLKTNSDTVAWLQVLGTTIDYPVVKTTNNTYYLTHSFTKEETKAGWIFADCNSNLTNLTYNTVIYGHRRLDNTMFGPLINVLKEEWLNSTNHLIKVSTPTNNMVFLIVSVYTINKESYYLKDYFPNPESYEEFLQTIKNRSIYDFNTTLNKFDKILTLSTCLDNFGKRIVVHSKLIKIETR